MVLSSLALVSPYMSAMASMESITARHLWGRLLSILRYSPSSSPMSLPTVMASLLPLDRPDIPSAMPFRSLSSWRPAGDAPFLREKLSDSSAAFIISFSQPNCDSSERSDTLVE